MGPPPPPHHQLRAVPPQAEPLPRGAPRVAEAQARRLRSPMQSHMQKAFPATTPPPCPTPAPLQGNGAAYGVTAPSPPSCWGGTPILSLSPLHPAPKVCTSATVGSAGDGGVPHGARLGQKKQSLVLCTGGTKDPPRPQTQPAQPSPSVACRGGGNSGLREVGFPPLQKKIQLGEPPPCAKLSEPQNAFGYGEKESSPWAPPWGQRWP